MDFKTIKDKSERRARQADAIDFKLRNMLVDEVEKIDGDSIEQMTMAVLVAMGMAKTILQGMLKAASVAPKEARAMLVAADFMANSLLGPELVKLNKLTKDANK